MQPNRSEVERLEMEEVVGTLGDHGARLTNLEGWQKAQNGHLVRTEAKIDRLQLWIMGQLAALVIMALGIWLRTK